MTRPSRAKRQKTVIPARAKYSVSARGLSRFVIITLIWWPRSGRTDAGAEGPFRSLAGNVLAVLVLGEPRWQSRGLVTAQPRLKSSFIYLANAVFDLRDN